MFINSCVCVVGMGAHHQVRHDDPEEDEGSAPAVRRLSARHAGQTQEGNRIGRNSSYDVWTSLCPCRLQGVCVCVCLLQTGLGGGSLLSLSDAVSQAARAAGVKPITSAERLQDDLESQELKEAYAEQVN